MGGRNHLELELELRHAGLAGEVVEDVGGGADDGDAARHDAEMQAQLLVRRLLAWLPAAGRGWGGRSLWRWGRCWVSAAGVVRGCCCCLNPRTMRLRWLNLERKRVVFTPVTLANCVFPRTLGPAQLPRNQECSYSARRPLLNRNRSPASFSFFS